jgi:hypothetical protein
MDSHHRLESVAKPGSPARSTATAKLNEILNDGGSVPNFVDEDRSSDRPVSHHSQVTIFSVEISLILLQ